jgi:membrane protease YdiL (CAAX protease family)
VSVRAYAAVIGLLAGGFLLGGPAVRMTLLLGASALILAGLVIVAVRRLRAKRLAWIPWVVSLLTSAAIVIPALTAGHPRHGDSRIAAGLISWLLFAAVLRGMLALGAYLRRAARRLPDSQPADEPGGERSHGDHALAREGADAVEVPPRRSFRRARWRRWLAPWPSPTREAKLWRPGYAVAALVLAQLLAVAVAGLLGAGNGLPAGAGATIVECCLLLTMLPLSRSRHIRGRDLGLKTVPGARSVGLAVLGLFAYGLSSAGWNVLVRPGRVSGTFAQINEQPVSVIVLAGMAAVVFAPLVEEIFFRGLLYRSMRNRMSVLPAALAAGALFGAIHWQYPLAVRPELMFFGVITALMYERTGSLLPGIALHSYVDSSGFVFALTGNALPVTLAFAGLALALLVRPPLRSLARVLRRRPAFVDYTLEPVLET